MSRFEAIQAHLNQLCPMPVNMPKLYLLGDTGAGKTTLVRKILGTDGLKFPSVQQKRTTVAVTEYVISKNLPFKATFIFKSEAQVFTLIQEILENAIEFSYKQNSKGTLSLADVAEKLEETPDERFRLKYILETDVLSDYANSIIGLLSTVTAEVEKLKHDLSTKEEDLPTVIELALNAISEQTAEIARSILGKVNQRVSEICSGKVLSSEANSFQYSASTRDELITRAKAFLSNAKSISPVIEYARLQGHLLAAWIPPNTELVLIDGEGIGHDAREASQLSARHLDYFHFADSIALVEESKKPFASGGKSAISGVYRNGYQNKFHLIFSKLDEVEVSEDEDNLRKAQIKAVNKGLSNVANALREDNINAEMAGDFTYHLANMKNEKPDDASIADIIRLICNINEAFHSEKPDFIEPIYDYEMLSAHMVPLSAKFVSRWQSLLYAKHWQTVKAFNRRMCWEHDEFRDLKPISDFHSLVTNELSLFLSNPKSWQVVATSSLQAQSIDAVKQEFSKLLLDLGRAMILKDHSEDWDGAMSYSGTGSTFTRLSEIISIIKSVFPDSKNMEAAAQVKDTIKMLVAESIQNACN